MDIWKSGHELTLLECGDAYYPRLLAKIRAARSEILLHTYIWSADSVGREFTDTFIEAANRGVDVRITVDGYGTPRFPDEQLSRLARAGAQVAVFDPATTSLQTNVLCRLHRKIAVIDGECAFVAGINICEQQLKSAGIHAMHDYAVEVRGPVVEQIVAACKLEHADTRGSHWQRWRGTLKPLRAYKVDPKVRHSSQAAFVLRDNGEHTADVEAMYRIAIRRAQTRIIIANAYFFPTYRFIRDLKRAAKRGVRVDLIMQGKSDVPISEQVAAFLYEDLASSGIKIHHYMDSAMHAKVAVIDGHWATVGSSNLDPISLAFNLEANLFALDATFATALLRSLDTLLLESCVEVAVARRSPALKRWLLRLIYRYTRRMSTWGRRMIGSKQRVRWLKVRSA